MIKAVEHENAKQYNLGRAYYNLGDAYLNGKGVNQNFEEAVKWLRLAEKENKFLVGNSLKVAEANLDMEKRVRELKQRNVISDTKLLAKIVEICLATRDSNKEFKDIAGDDIEALRKTAEQGNASAQYRLGNHYAQRKHQYVSGGAYTESRGVYVAADINEAAKYYLLAAEQGHVYARKCLVDLLVVQRTYENNNNKLFRLAADLKLIGNLGGDSMFCTIVSVIENGNDDPLRDIILQNRDYVNFQYNASGDKDRASRINSLGRGITLLSYFAAHGNIEAVQKLIEHNADVNQGGYKSVGDENDIGEWVFPLQVAVNNKTLSVEKRIAMIQELVKAGANIHAVNRKDDDDSTSEKSPVHAPLICFAVNDPEIEPEIVKCLLDLGADPTSAKTRVRKYEGTEYTPWRRTLSVTTTDLINRDMYTGEETYLETTTPFTVRQGVTATDIYKDYDEVIDLMSIASSAEKKALLEKARKNWKK